MHSRNGKMRGEFGKGGNRYVGKRKERYPEVGRENRRNKPSYHVHTYLSSSLPLYPARDPWNRNQFTGTGCPRGGYKWIGAC